MWYLDKIVYDGHQRSISRNAYLDQSLNLAVLDLYTRIVTIINCGEFEFYMTAEDISNLSKIIERTRMFLTSEIDTEYVYQFISDAGVRIVLKLYETAGL